MLHEEVQDEVERKSADTKKFKTADEMLAERVVAGEVEILVADINDPNFTQAVQVASGVRFEVRKGRSKDLGELMVTAHARARQADGDLAFAFIDEWRGQQMAGRCGVKIITTEQILDQAIKHLYITDHSEMKKVYDELRTFDDGLVDFSQTTLNGKQQYRDARAAVALRDASEATAVA